LVLWVHRLLRYGHQKKDTKDLGNNVSAKYLDDWLYESTSISDMPIIRFRRYTSWRSSGHTVEGKRDGWRWLGGWIVGYCESSWPLYVYTPQATVAIGTSTILKHKAARIWSTWRNIEPSLYGFNAYTDSAQAQASIPGYQPSPLLGFLHKAWPIHSILSV